MTETLIVCNVNPGWETDVKHTMNAITNYLSAIDPENICTQIPMSANWAYHVLYFIFYY